MGARQELVPSGSSMPALPATRSFEPLPPDEDTSWFLDALQVLIEQRRVIATVLALAAVALTGYVLTAPQTRLFEARAQILVEPDSSAPLDAARASGTVDPE